MKILRKKEILFSKAKFVNPSKGLMFCKKLKNNEAVVLDVKNYSGAIHMWFVFFSINVVWLNESFEVIDFKKNIKPFTVYVKPRIRPRYIIEYTNSNLSFERGDKLLFSSS